MADLVLEARVRREGQHETPLHSRVLNFARSCKHQCSLFFQASTPFFVSLSPQVCQRPSLLRVSPSNIPASNKQVDPE